MIQIDSASAVLLYEKDLRYTLLRTSESVTDRKERDSPAKPHSQHRDVAVVRRVSFEHRLGPDANGGGSRPGGPIRCKGVRC